MFAVATYSSGSDLQYLLQNVATALMKTPAAEPSGMAENCAVGPWVLRRHRELAKATTHNYYVVTAKAPSQVCVESKPRIDLK